ncbi:single-stranded-DNA-specific exonuclease RecJ [Candidatus Campbellbacteria bacterium CG11_big_fil_rev_8_21_14_0_20_44_21]|uniref:Single-stranded-DNA-specific exonuclease RecJ n=1 Tax=Candidatus Campbellbacteria bacterium CG22_combo_CG10-13_8_21_14_all_43_18 TaxID=1974530 RepID=A0A2H0DWX1_9BACT|nr:MAG: single-stranded-DNA-specific exonuclease RecJ [Candidatus Campbellbacteria bacterium CG22_combo_CG10-13_8_21_14_all_43_18]PIR24464.1 MAG: single-stranded-DNA-specific exonuclease RecJ [Candidatus Campbellbacteria bacterium CG11_big_fil_rev_8_21_14_0_20_44_21]
MQKYQIRKEIPEKIKNKLSDYSPLVQKLLFEREIDTKEKAEKFFNPDYERDTHDFYLLKDIKKAVRRILKAVKENEKILIYSDYDADGIPGAVVLHDFFVEIGFSNFENHIPHRNEDGFGLNSKTLKEISQKKVGLIITIDCGIMGVKEVEEAAALGMEVIITDHHLPGSLLPRAHSIINPNQKGDKYPFKHLCGCAVVFKLVQALIKEGRFEIKDGWDKWLLDMVGFATVSDMVPLVGENRTLSHFGLVVLRKTRRPGLRSLYKENFLKPEVISEDDLSFVLTPRINAASRMDEVHLAFDLLRTRDEGLAEAGAEKLNKLNDKRKMAVASMAKSVRMKISKMVEEPKIIVAGNSEWMPSLLGPVASSLAENFNKPVFLWGQNGDNEIRGSCRSDQRLDVFELMKSLPMGLLLNFGGHKFSGGFVVARDRIHFFEEEILKAYKNFNLTEEALPLMIDAELSLKDVDWNLTRDLLKFAPYGKGNKKPVFLFRDVSPDEFDKFGKNKEHLKIVFKEGLRKPLQAVKFFSKDDDNLIRLKEKTKFDLAASIEVSYFRNFPELRLRIIDFF